MAIGSVLFCAFYLQVSGLAQTSSNHNAFVTGLNVLIVPILAYFLGQRLGWLLLLGAVLGVLGVLGLGGLFYEQAPWSRGDTLTLMGAFVYAVYVLMFEFSARAKTALRPERIALVQSGVMVLLASALMMWLQAWGQHRVRAVEAALAAVWWINEYLSGRALLGGALIVLGVVISQIKPSRGPA